MKKTEIKKVLINFNEPHITYKNKNEQKIPGVTTVLGILAKPALIMWAYNKGKDGENLYEKDESANIGTVIHARILGYFLGYEIDNYNISPQIWNWSENSLASFKEYVKGKKIEPILAETPLISEKYQYGGTLDLYAKVDNKLELWDFKTGSGIYDEHIYQLAALNNLLIENGYDPPERIMPVNIPKSPDDSFAIQSISADELKDEFQIFLSCLKIYKLQKQIKNKRKGKYANKRF
jgi:hypothetical protein